jgi:hypothetical protein
VSSQFDKLHDFIDTTVILKWPHESLRWGYFAILRGNRDIGDIPIIQSPYASRWRSFYEWSTSQPYTVELRHAKQLLHFNPFIVRIVGSIDQELTQDKSWARTELYQQPEGLFRGFYYQSGACNLHIRGGAYTEIFEGISPFTTSYMPINHASRHRVWKKFFAAYKNEDIELLPPLVHKLFEKLIVYEGRSAQDKVDILLNNNNNTIFFIYKRGLIITLQKTPFPSEVISFPKSPIFIEHNHEEIIQSQGDITSGSSSSSYSERDVRDKGKAKRKGRRKKMGSSSAEEESAV